MAIPFKTLSFDPDNDVWGINFARWLARERKNSGWSSQERRIILVHSGDLRGLVGMDQASGWMSFRRSSREKPRLMKLRRKPAIWSRRSTLSTVSTKVLRGH